MVDRPRFRNNYKKIGAGKILIYCLLFIGIILIMGITNNCRNNKLPPLPFGKSGADTLDVAIVYAPLSFYLYSDTIGGINYDLLRQFERETETPVKFWPVVDLKESFNNVENGIVNLLASVPSDYELKKRFFVTESIYLDRLVLIQLIDSTDNETVKSSLDLGGKTVYITEGSPSETRLRNLADEIGNTIDIKWEKGLSEEYLCIKVASKEIPFAIVNEQTAKKMGQHYKNLSYDTPISFTQFQVWLMQKEDTSINSKINNWLIRFKETDSYWNIIKKYM